MTEIREKGARTRWKYRFSHSLEGKRISCEVLIWQIVNMMIEVELTNLCWAEEYIRRRASLCFRTCQICEMCILSFLKKSFYDWKIFYVVSSPGEDVYHWIYSVFLVSIRKRHDFNSVGEEGAIKEPVQQKHLAWNENFINNGKLWENSIKFRSIQEVSFVSKLERKLPNLKIYYSRY